MVNVRATVDEARRKAIWDSEICLTVLDAAKSIFYKERTWDSIFDYALTSRLSAWQVDRARFSLQSVNTDLKRNDALELVETVLLRHPKAD